MIHKVRDLFLTDTGKDTFIVLIGTLINVFLAGIFFIMAPRVLGPADYGLFSTVVATGFMIIAISNFGIDTGILRFAGTEAKKQNKLFSIAFKAYLVIGLGFTLLGLFLSPLIAIFFNQPEIVNLLRIAFVATIFILLSNFFTAALQARKEFAKASLINISTNITRVLLVVLAFYFLKLGLLLITLIFFFTPIISVVLGKILLPFRLVKTEKSQNISFLKFNFWIAAAFLIAAVPYDNYFLLKITGPIQVGLYAAPFKVLTFAHQFGGNFTRVLASRFASFDTTEKVIRFTKKSSVLVTFFIINLAILFIFAKPVTLILFGEQFIESTHIMQILTVAFGFFFMTLIPSSIILYYFGNSKATFFITLIRILVFVLVLSAFVPKSGAIGAAYAFLFAEITAFILMSAYTLIKLNSK
ncbi:MAG: MatE family [Candidatus Curtissbacteria bacterium GW2011_GWA1_41_11]|uniref:MatE family n=1 Tax=Candidatus Curtissbacteria bacterium GW2011_GWA1_41_11 TaxID=1618409 RepID=A0A0G0UH38_9BACT|nr:MAG: MatE family [Candidatus Curtissbacteria bacterium GW2011_GWA1_41_11]